MRSLIAGVLCLCSGAALGCDLNQTPCQATLPDGNSVTLSVSPRPIPVLKPLELVLEFDGGEVQAVEGGISGINFDMGRQPVIFYREDNAFRARTSLGLCAKSRMEWRLELEVATGDGPPQPVEFQFHTVYKPPMVILE